MSAYADPHALLPLAHREWLRRTHGERYQRGRWTYLRHVARIVRELAPRSVLEVGPGPLPFVPGSRTLDVDASLSPTFLHDAGAAPWPLVGAVELVLGLQCWEHLGPRESGRQAVAFAEARRVAGPDGHVLLSFPYRWQRANAMHRDIDDDVIAAWTSGVTPERAIRVRAVPHRQRWIGLWQGEAT